MKEEQGACDCLVIPEQPQDNHLAQRKNMHDKLPETGDRRKKPAASPPLSLVFGSIGIIDPAVLNPAMIAEISDFLANRGPAERAGDFRILLARFSEAVRAGITDPLTGLWNRKGFEQKIEYKIEGIRRRETGLMPRKVAQPDMAAIFIDLDGFKAVNDHCGHEVGDEALKEVARRLKAAFRADDIIARIGGDEITLMLEPYTPDENFNEDHIEGRIRKALEGLVYWHDAKPYPICASIGIFTFNAETIQTFGDRPSADIAAEIMSNADHRMYLDKQAGKTMRLDAARDDALLRHPAA